MDGVVPLSRLCCYLSRGFRDEHVIYVIELNHPHLHFLHGLQPQALEDFSSSLNMRSTSVIFFFETILFFKWFIYHMVEDHPDRSGLFEICWNTCVFLSFSARAWISHHKFLTMWESFQGTFSKEPPCASILRVHPDFEGLVHLNHSASNDLNMIKTRSRMWGWNSVMAACATGRRFPRGRYLRTTWR